MHTSLQTNDGHSSARHKSEYVYSKMRTSPNSFCHHCTVYSDHEKVTWQQHLGQTPFELSQSLPLLHCGMLHIGCIKNIALA